MFIIEPTSGATDSKVSAPDGADSGNVVKLSDHKAKPKKAAAKKAAAKKAPAKEKATSTKGGNKKITLVTKECPARKGSNRAKLWAKLKSGMTLAEAREAGIPLRYLKKMAKGKHLKIAA